MKKLASFLAIMPSVLFLLLFISLNSQAQDQPSGRIAMKVAGLKQKGYFKNETTIFSVPPQVETDHEISGIIKKYTLMDAHSVEEILLSKPGSLNFSVPVENGSRQLKVLLYKESISPNGFTLINSNGTTVSSQQDIVHYRGSIDGDLHSVAAFSFSGNEVAGLINNSEGNYVIGKLHNNSGKHIIYNDKDLVAPVPFDCATNTSIPISPSNFARTEGITALTTKCVNWYWETDYDMFVSKGTVDSVNRYMQGVFNQMATLYANDGMTMTLKTLYVWTTADPYTGPTTSDYLNQFGAYRTSFNGDLAHLIGLKGSGGIAWINGLCKTAKYKMAYSGISTTYKTVPSFSWSVECITHEQGHLLGSRHTHDCAWNGNNTKIDGCGDAAGYTSGTCAVPALPVGGGTIMSYCHLTSAGINFNLGFGPQPTTLMINTINAASCLASCTSCTVPPQPGNITGSGTVCAGSSQTYSVTAVSGATSYAWTLPSGWTGSSTTNSITVTAGSAGGSVSVTATNSCGSSSAQILAVTASALPAQPGTISGNISVCAATSQTYAVATVTGAASYTWTLPSGWSGSSITNSIIVTTGSAGGTISVKANNNCGSSIVRTVSASITSIIPAQPAAITGNTSICQGSSQTYTASVVQGASSYAWTLPSGWTGSSTTNTIVVTAGSAAGTISVTATNGCGTGSASTLDISISSLLPATPGTITVSGGTTAVCSVDIRTYTTPLVTGITYTWTAPAGSTITSGQGTNSIQLSFGSNFTSGSVLSVKAGNSCGSSGARNLTISRNNPAMPGSISIAGGITKVCQGDIRTYTVPLVSGMTYNWIAPTGAMITSGQGTSSIQVSYTSNFTAQGTLKVTANNNCGTSSARTLTVYLNVLPRPGSIAGVTTVCPGSQSSYIASTVTGATSYVWRIPADAIIQGGSTGSTIRVLWGSTGGTIGVKAVNACGSSTERSVSVSTNCSAGITTVVTSTQASVYPNPARERVTVRFDSRDNIPYTVRITDMTGRTLLTEAHSGVRGINTHSFNVSKLSKGSYLISIQGKDDKKILRMNVE